MSKKIDLKKIALSDMDIITETKLKSGGHAVDELFGIWTITTVDGHPIIDY